LLSRSEGVSDLGPEPLFDLRKPAGHLTPRHPHLKLSLTSAASHVETSSAVGAVDRAPRRSLIPPPGRDEPRWPPGANAGRQSAMEARVGVPGRVPGGNQTTLHRRC
jgi:hypothetical protein